MRNKTILENISKKYSNVYFYDLTKSKILKNKPGFVNDTVAYYDQGHLNYWGSKKLAEDLESDFMTFFDNMRKK